jgi:hypothetical protein
VIGVVGRGWRYPRYLFHACERIGNHFIEAAASQNVAGLLFAGQFRVRVGVGQWISQRRIRNTLIAIDAGDLFAQVGQANDVLAERRYADLDSHCIEDRPYLCHIANAERALYLGIEAKQVEQIRDLVGVQLDTEQAMDLARR